MLTLKLINEETERVIRGLEKKHFEGAAEAIAAVQATDKRRREAQAQLDQLLSESKKKAAEIGALMKQGKREEAEQAKSAVAAIKEQAKALETAMDEAQKQVNDMLCQIPNIPYDEVPEGRTAEDNLVVKYNPTPAELPCGQELNITIAEFTKKYANELPTVDEEPEAGSPLPHWETS